VNSAYSNEDSATTKPVAPSNLIATAVSSSQINIVWTDNSFYEEGYRIARKIGAGGTWENLTSVSANVHSYQNTGLNQHTTYYYVVAAYYGTSISDPSNEASATTPYDTPAAPSNLTATAVSASQINLAWIDNSDNETGFKIERKTGADGTWSEIAATSANVTTYSNTGLSQSTTYYYRVRAVRVNVYSDYSNDAHANTELAPPSNLTVTAVSASQINLQWTEVAGAESYKVYSSSSPETGFTEDTSGTFNGTSWTAPFSEDRRFYYVTWVGFTVTLGFVFVPGGTFIMGDTIDDGVGDILELPTHSVTLDPFFIGKYEVTQVEYSQYMQPGWEWTSSYGLGDYYPAYYVSWYAILKYCNLRSLAEGLTPVYSISGSTNPATWGAVPTGVLYDATWDAAICNWSANGYRLPTEAEWEYAARGAVDPPDYLYSGSDDVNAVARYDGNNSPYGTKPVGTKAPNELGIFDMSGNVYEFCWDWFGFYSSTSQTNPTGPSSESHRLLRGGDWFENAWGCRVSRRNMHYPGDTNSYSYGFRLCRSMN